MSSSALIHTPYRKGLWFASLVILGYLLRLPVAAWAQCTYTIAPTSASHGPRAETGSVTVTPSAKDCDWTASSRLDWITITSGSSGTGPGTVGYSVAANPGPGSGESRQTAEVNITPPYRKLSQPPVPNPDHKDLLISPIGHLSNASSKVSSSQKRLAPPNRV